MQRGKLSAEALGREVEIDMDYVNACLWAFGATGLLQKDAMTARGADPAREAAKPLSGLLGRLARHFGLSRG